MHESLRQFHPVIGKWFEERVGVPTPPQVMGWPVIGGGKSGLILAPTGSGKTLAAFLAAIDWLVKRLMAAEAAGGSVWGVQILYVSPLKSLANDVQKNLMKPLAELAEVAAGMGEKEGGEWPEVTVGVRTGDTPSKERAALVRRPPHILITTPESLNLMLTSGARGMLSTVRFVIVDEVHALAGGKRGVFLSLILERLEEERRGVAGNDEARMTNDESNPKGKMTNVRNKERSRGGRSRGLKIAPGVYVPVEEEGPMVRIGLSATARPEEVIARWLAGCDEKGEARGMEIVRSGQRKRLDLEVVCPFGEGGGRGEGLEEEPELMEGGGEKKKEEKSKGAGHWPEVTRAVLEMIREHRSTLVFGNSRRLVERLAGRLIEVLAEEGAGGTGGGIQNSEFRIQNERREGRVPVILPHHGSISKEVRLETEQALKRGEVDAVLATSSLELGIDIGALDLVVQIDSPGNVAAGLQRVGRAGHLEKATAKGRFVVRGLYELPSFGALVPLMFEGRVEETRVPENCLDVLAQQIVAACVVRPWKRRALFEVVRRAMPYRGLTEKQFDLVVGMLSKRAERVTNQGLRPRISFDRVNDELIVMPGTAKVLLMNSGVIADTGQFPVFLAGSTRGRVELGDGSPREEAQAQWGSGKKEAGGPGVRLGELDEEFVYETKEGDRVVLGSQTWRVVRIDADRVLVEAAAPGSSRMPFWRGEQAPRSEMLGEAVARFHLEMERRLKAEEDEATVQWLMRERHFDVRSAENAIVFYRRQMAKGVLPAEGRVVVEHFVDRTGEPVIAILLPFGRRVNYALRLALEGQFARRRLPAQLVHHDDGIVIRPPVEVGEIPENPLAWLKSGTLEQEIVDQIEGTALFGLRFRQNAARALMLPRMTLSQRTPLWQQRLRARHLLALVKQQRNFPIIVETYRECLQDVLNIGKVAELLGQIERGEWAVTVVKNQGGAVGGSPFARALFSQFMSTYLYAQDDPLLAAEIQPAVDQHILDEILQRRRGGDGEKATAGGEVVPAWSAADEELLRRRILGTDYPARTAEELLEKIEAAGAVGAEMDVTDEGWGAWVVGGVDEARQMLQELMEKRRVLGVRLTKRKGEGGRVVATENLGLLLAARGGEEVGLWRMAGGKKVAVAYEELPGALLESAMGMEEAQRVVVEQAMKREPLVTAAQVAEKLPWMGKRVAGLVEGLVREGLVQKVAGEGERLIWAEYAEQLRTYALRRERRLAATVEFGALQRHLLGWQHVMPAKGGRGTGAEDREALDRLEDVLDLMTGLAFPLTFWEHDLLMARVPGFAPAMLDGIAASGHRVWVGAGGGGEEVAVAFWPRHLLGTRPAVGGAEAELPLSKDAERVRGHLQTAGASFFFDMQLALGMADADVAAGLVELARRGAVSADQLQSLRDVQRLAANAARDRARGPVSPRLHATHPRHVPRPAKMPRHWWKNSTGAMTAGSLGGRWFLLPPAAVAGNAIELAERATERVDRLLRRTAFACRELLEPTLDGSWRDAYDVLTRMEWAGTVRRGYFVDGIQGSQFALPSVRLDAPAVVGEVTWLAMLDPANLWAQGSTRWISDTGLAARVPRAPGNWVALVEGRPVLAVTSWGQRLIPLPAPEEHQRRALETVATLFSRLPREGHPYLMVKFWDQQEILGSPAEEALRRQGFSRDTQGLRLYRQYLSPGPASGASGEIEEASRPPTQE